MKAHKLGEAQNIGGQKNTIDVPIFLHQTSYPSYERSLRCPPLLQAVFLSNVDHMLDVVCPCWKSHTRTWKEGFDKVNFIFDLKLL